MNVYCIVLVYLLMALVKYVTGHLSEEDAQVELAHNCQIDTGGAEFEIIVTATINGAVTALDGATGQVMWRNQDLPLIDGTLSTAGPIDIGGTSLQLMPTLDGSLFSYSHQINLIEPLPITTDSLLESTIRLGQDAVAGGKSVSTKGYDLFTGEMKYQCTIDSCTNDNEEAIPENPVLLVKRISNSIRAMDTLRGVERWNLSTAEIDVSLAGGMPTEHIATSSGLRILLQPPDGVVVAVNEYNRQEWKTDIDGHIVNVWKITGNRISEISLFDPSNIYTTQFEVMHRTEKNMQTQSSLLYMGTSEGYPFIIQSPKAKRSLRKQMNDINEMNQISEFTNPKSCSASNGIAYRVEDTALRVVLRDAFKQSRSKAIEDKSPNVVSSRGQLQIVAPHESAQTIGTENLRSTSLSHGGDYGYLVLETEKQSRKVPSPISIVQSMIGYVFSPIMIASSLTGFLGIALTVFLNQIRKRRRIEEVSRETTKSESESSSVETQAVALIQDLNETDCSERRVSSPCRLSQDPSEKLAIVKTLSKGRKLQKNNNSDSLSSDAKNKMQILRSRTISKSSIEGFTSRFAEEFAVKKVIGHGGFGVVFRAQSITDRNEYAVKRIAVADNDAARNRVLREARALAMFDHPAIIRYFYAWEERPPRGFQDKEDESLLRKIKTERSAKLHKKLKEQSENARTETTSFVGSFEMPPVVGNTTSTSWSDIKPKEIRGKKRTTSESKRGLNGESDTTAEIKKEKSVKFSADSSDEESDFSDESSSSSDESSSLSDASVDIYQAQSSSGGIIFERNSVSKSDKEDVKKQTSIHNKVMIVETESQEWGVRTTDSGECAYLYIVMQLCAEKTLEHWIRRNKSLESRSLRTMKSWIKQLASGLEYLHTKGFIHRDLKPGNVFFSLDSTPDHHILKIGDLGLATKTDGAPQITSRQNSNSDVRHTKNVGTRSYMSPEQLSHQEYTSKVDIFALGLMATEMIVPFDTVMERVQTFSDYQKGVVPAILDKYAESRDFLLLLTCSDPTKRPTAAQVARHEFLN